MSRTSGATTGSGGGVGSHHCCCQQPTFKRFPTALHPESRLLYREKQHCHRNVAIIIVTLLMARTSFGVFRMGQSRALSHLTFITTPWNEYLILFHFQMRNTRLTEMNSPKLTQRGSGNTGIWIETIQLPTGIFLILTLMRRTDSGRQVNISR